MLNANDIAGLRKHAQEGFFGDYSAPRLPTSVDAFMSANAPTLADLYAAVRSDHGLGDAERQRVLSQIQAAVGGASSSTAISALMRQGLGGILGYLIGKYFGMGIVGQAVSAFAGFGLGRAINEHLNKANDPYKGYRLM